MCSNLPAGAEFDRHAPYNEPSIDGMELQVVAECILSSKGAIYSPKAFKEWDEEGYCGVNTFNSNLEEDFKKVRYTPLQLIRILHNEMVQKLAMLPKDAIEEIKMCKDIIDECDSWEEDDFHVVSLE